MSDENSRAGPSPFAAASAAILDIIAFDEKGLVPAIVQQAESGEVLMLAWMNREAVEKTLKTGLAHYYSRSRDALWRKGESSGQTQLLRDFRIDCDGDTVLLVVDQEGVACHTGRHNCFYRAPRDAGALTEIHPVIVSPEDLYGKADDGS
ncbi:MAG: phosphoribosyl-AMP cyclohydrolase [Alphaproteobacteria bacterium]|nr:phosphoribosyl-AMP cyclohydrolase [Alphaproteobacteria bacterium]